MPILQGPGPLFQRPLTSGKRARLRAPLRHARAVGLTIPPDPRACRSDPV